MEFTDEKPIVRLNRRQLVQGLASGSVVAFAAGCSASPVTGRQQLILVSNEQLAQLSSGAWEEVKQKEKISRDPKLNNQLLRVGRKITVAAGQADKTWSYAVFDSKQKNAFVLPGRQVGFYSGLMNLADNDDQIAAVMGHEVGHVTGRHSAERYSQQIAAGIGLTAAGIALGDDNKELAAILGAGVTFGIILPYSRKHELEADKIGVDYMARAGYDPMQAVAFWDKMNAGGGSRPPEFLSTHPSPETRMRELREYIRARGYA
jgi:predicted Zn-dependent protease